MSLGRRPEVCALLSLWCKPEVLSPRPPRPRPPPFTRANNIAKNKEARLACRACQDDIKRAGEPLQQVVRVVVVSFIQLAMGER